MANPTRKPLPPQEFLEQILHYDPETGIVRWKIREVVTQWDKLVNTRFAGHVVGTRTTTGYLSIFISGNHYRLHRIIWKLMTGEEPQYLDHKSGDKKDNRWENLRACTASQSQCSRAQPRNGRPGYKGIEVTRSGKFHVRIKAEGRDYHCGTYLLLEDAVMAANNARRNLHGVFARHD